MKHATAQVKAAAALPSDATGRAGRAVDSGPPIRDGWPRRLWPRPIRDGAGTARFGTEPERKVFSGLAFRLRRTRLSRQE